MFKLALKVGIFILVALGASMFLSGDKVAANVGQCPGSFQDAQNNLRWGVSPTYNGSHGGDMAGLIVHAYDASTGQNIDTAYHINSGISPNDPDWGIVNGTQTNLNNRIFQDVAGTFSNRTNSFQSGTNDPLYFASVQCTGWDAFGPQDIDTSQVGNGYVLDCGPSASPTHFWFSNIRPNPIGDGVNGQSGYWSIQVIGPGPGNNINIDHYTEGSMNFNTSFTVTNGSNTYVNMVWHPQNWTLNGNSSVNKSTVNPGGAATFTHQVKNNGPGTATYRWTVMKKFPGDSGYSELGNDDSNGNVTVGAGGYSPNQNPVLNIPSSAGEGDEYCEYIYFTNAAGANTGAGQTNPVCVTVHHGGGNQADGTCTKLQVSVTGNYYGQRKRTHVEISYTNKGSPGGGVQPYNYYSDYVPGTGGTGPNNSNTYTQNYSYQPENNAIEVTVTAEYLPSGNNTSWTPIGGSQHIRTLSQLCFSATCSITSVTGDIHPGGLVAAGGTMHITGTYTNTSPPPDNLALWNPVIQYAANGQDYPAGGIVTKALGNGGTYDFSFPVQNTDTTPSVSSVSFTPVYFNNQAIGPPCRFDNIWSFQQFSASAQPYSKLSPTREDATSDYCYAYLNISGTNHTVNLGTYTTYTKNGGVLYAGSGGAYGPGMAYTLGGNATGSPPGVICAYTVPNGHDQFCANITLNYTGGWVGPDSNVYNGTGGRNPALGNAPPSCDNEYNEPYFKVLGAGAAADLSAVKKPDTSGTLTCTAETNPGLLAGWNDNTNDGSSDFNGINRGAGSQLSSLALLKITGFASAQTTYRISSGTPGSGLSFANSGAGVQVNTAAESPSLGGSYGSVARCVKPPQPDASVAQTASPGGLDLSTVTGQAKSYKGNLTLGNSAPYLSGDTSIFVDGTVYISSNLQLNPAGWTIKNDGTTTVPSFTLTATGNIYIAPGVTQLDGLYTSSGTIYTCGSAYAAMPASQLYDSCHNQLVFNGSVMANQVKMMRTFGSLRDEKSHPGIPGIPGTPARNGPSRGFGWGSAGPAAGVPCFQVAEGSDPYTWNDNYLCVYNDPSLRLRWTSWADSPDYSDPDASSSSTINLNAVRSKYPYCVQWNVPDPSTWYDNYLCANQNIGLSFGNSPIPGQDCANISESSDPDANWSHGGYWLCAPFPVIPGTPGTPATPATPNLTPACSHGPSEGGVQILPYTCAAEVIHFSPEMYLGNQKIDEDSRGAVQYDSLTSLPPVL